MRAGITSGIVIVCLACGASVAAADGPWTPDADFKLATACVGAETTPTAAPAEGSAESALAELAKKITVTTASEDNHLVLGGAIVADFIFSTARPVAPGTPFFLTPDSPFGHSQDTFDAHARQTTLYGLVVGPKVCDFESGGLILVNLYNDAVVVDRYGLLPIQAYGQLKNDFWRFAAGLRLDIFNPLIPTVLPFSYLFASGNAGAYRGQARVERSYYPTPVSQITLTGGISEPIPTTLSQDFEISEDNGWPNVEGRAALALGPIYGEGPTARHPFEVGVSGIMGQVRTTSGATRVVADVWGGGLDCRWAFTPYCGLQGECFIGETLGTYGGGIMQNVNPATFEGIESEGAWIEFYYYLCPEKLHTHMGYGVDDPRDEDLTLLQPRRNETWFANLIWDVNKAFRVALEVTWRETQYSGILLDNDGIGVHTQARWNF